MVFTVADCNLDLFVMGVLTKKKHFFLGSKIFEEKKLYRSRGRGTQIGTGLTGTRVPTTFLVEF
jgi:hypothetical protein